MDCPIFLFSIAALDPDQSTQDLESGVPLPEEKIFNVSIQ